jgi:23S rRNA (pseudouridine1915-N3)-methyltransferase
MADWLVLAVGRAGDGPEAELFERYAGRLQPKLRLLEIAPARGSPTEICRREAAALLAAVPDCAVLVALDAGGTTPDSAGLARIWQGWRDGGRPVTFAIGGAEGLDGAVVDRAALRLSLGPLTWPHLLARAMLAEQLYRAQSIATGHPYHRGRRP